MKSRLEDAKFLSTPSARRATSSGGKNTSQKIFLSTPSARRATRGGMQMFERLRISIHALREEGDQHPAGRQRKKGVISIHALREEGDPTAWWPLLTGTYFYPRPPRGGRPDATSCKVSCEEFLSTPSARRATPADEKHHPAAKNFYPRPPRGGRQGLPRDGLPPGKFLSTPSARRATARVLNETTGQYISIHALREEGDNRTCAGSSPASDFYPRPPRGGRPASVDAV